MNLVIRGATEMNEIEKMYENTNTYKNLCECAFKNLYDYCINYGQDGCTHPISEISNGCENCKLAEQNVKYYPPFTAEKQLSLMTFLINRKVGLSFKAEQGEITVEAISRGLAGIVNRIWQSLTEEEKQQIKEILK